MAMTKYETGSHAEACELLRQDMASIVDALVRARAALGVLRERGGALNIGHRALRGTIAHELERFDAVLRTLTDRGSDPS